jgi:hypothetical protein
MNSWRDVSLGERRGENNDPGAKWGSDVALVPVHQLMGYREYDRKGAEDTGRSASTIENIAGDLRSKGVEGMREPAYLLYNHEHKWGYLGEGHHRLEAAAQAGVPHIPVRVLKASAGQVAEHKRKGLGGPMHLDNRVVETNGYMPSNLHPGNFKEFEGHR